MSFRAAETTPRLAAFDAFGIAAQVRRGPGGAEGASGARGAADAGATEARGTTTL